MTEEKNPNLLQIEVNVSRLFLNRQCFIFLRK